MSSYIAAPLLVLIYGVLGVRTAPGISLYFYDFGVDEYGAAEDAG